MAMFVGAVFWILSGLVIVLLGVVIDVDSPIISNVAYWLDALGFRLFISSFALVLGLALLTREARQGERAGSSEERVAASPLARWDGVLERVLVVSLGVWILMAIWTNIFFRPPLDFDATEDPGWLVTQTIQSLALRTWIAALVLLAISWARHVRTRIRDSSVPD
jgi:hypothetical protein